jgi:hypothetical protein
MALTVPFTALEIRRLYPGERRFVTAALVHGASANALSLERGLGLQFRGSQLRICTYGFHVIHMKPLY